MRRLQSALTILAVFSLLLTLAADVHAAAPPAQKAKWTVMVYISGDNDLEWYVVDDIETELAVLDPQAEVQVVALADRGPGRDSSSGDWEGTLLFHVTNGLKALPENAEEDWGEKNMADPQTLIDFVTWTRANYPADRYALYFWGHGWNWHPGYTMRDETLDDRDNDPDSFDTLDMDEMKAALPSIGSIDMVGYDGCNMAAIEVQLLWHGYATALTHSQEFVFSEGVQYDLVLTQLAENSTMSAEELAILTSETATADRTWSAVALDDEFDKLIQAVDDWSIALKQGLPQNRRKYDQAFTATRSFWKAPTDKDLYDMAYEIDRLVGNSNPNLRTTSRAVMEAVDGVVLYERHVNGYADAHGITIYHISKAVQKDSDYRYYTTPPTRLDFALQTGWDEFLDVYAR